jgi:hypothetical protein
MRKLLVSFVRRNSNGTNDPKLSLSLREIPIQDTFMVLPMADIGRNIFILWFRMMGGFKAMSNLRHILQTITRICLGNRKKVLFLLIRPKQMISPRCLWRKMVFLMNLIQRKRL